MNKIEKSIVFLLFICFMYSTQFAKILAIFNETFTDPIISINEEMFFVQDTSTYKIHIYSTSDFKEIGSFVNIGNGPNELSKGFIARVLKGYIFIPQRGKALYYSKVGILLKEVKVPQKFSLQTYPIGEKIVGRYAPQETMQNVGGRIEYRLCMFTPGKDNFTDIYKYFIDVRAIKSGSEKREIQIPAKWNVSTLSDGQNIVIGDRSRGMYFCIVNQSGEISKEINIAYTRRLITAKDRKNILKDSEQKYGPLWTRIKNTYEIKFPKYFPPFDSFRIDNGKIYVITDYLEHGKRECFIVNYDGVILKRTLIRSVNSYTIFKGRMYYLIDNENNQNWELHVEEIE